MYSFIRTTRLFLLLPALLLGSMLAQTNEASENLLKEQLKKFAADYAHFPTHKDKDLLLNYFHPDATATIFVFNLKGKARLQHTSLKDFAGFLDYISKIENYHIGYEITEIVDVEATGPIATAVYKVNYELKEPNGIWVKGKETVSMALQKFQGAWKILHYTFMQIEDEQLRGQCICELFRSSGGKVMANTTIPSGQGYITTTDMFEFPPSSREQIARVGANEYLRKANGSLVLRVEQGEDIEIGTAQSSSPRDMIKAIVVQHLYSEACTTLKYVAN